MHRRIVAVGLLLLLLTLCAPAGGPSRIGPKPPWEARYETCEAQLPPTPSEQRITIMINGYPERQKAIFLNETFYYEVARCLSSSVPLPIVEGRLYLSGPRYSIDIQHSSARFANDGVDYSPPVEYTNGRVYLPFDLTRYISSWFDEATQTLYLEANRTSPSFRAPGLLQ